MIKLVFTCQFSVTETDAIRLGLRNKSHLHRVNTHNELKIQRVENVCQPRVASKEMKYFNFAPHNPVFKKLRYESHIVAKLC